MTTSDSTATRDLKSLFCERFKCQPADFERRALRKCLYFHAMMFAPLVRWLNPACFERDLVFIDYFGKATNGQEVTAEIAALHYLDRTEPRFVRNSLRLRTSGRKAAKLAARLFHP